MNRQTVTELGTKADPLKDRIEVDGKPLSTNAPKLYLLLNKPKGVISSAMDPEGRPIVTDIVKKRYKKARVFPIGRLDYDAEGVIILTNDGELTNKLIHPRFKIQKRYLVKVRNVPSASALNKLERGVTLEDGRTHPALARFVRSTAENSWIELTVTEGRNRLIKRMCMAVGHPVTKLKRTYFAGVSVRGLKPGEFRELTEKEVERLKSLTSKHAQLKKERVKVAAKTAPKVTKKKIAIKPKPKRGVKTGAKKGPKAPATRARKAASKKISKMTKKSAPKRGIKKSAPKKKRRS